MKIYNFREVSSTNEYAKDLLESNELICVTALNQTNGKGRNQNNWFGSFGNNIYMSFGITHKVECSAEKLSSFQAVGALTVKRTLEKLSSEIVCKLKYPNDVYVKFNDSFRKISGILVEHGFSGSNCIYTIIGIGINVNESKFPDSLSQTAISLKMLGVNHKIEMINDIIIEEFEKLFGIDYKEITNLWSKELNIFNKEIRVMNKSQNELFNVKEIMNDGRLKLINVKNEVVIIDNGDTIRYNLD